MDLLFLFPTFLKKKDITLVYNFKETGLLVVFPTYLLYSFSAWAEELSIVTSTESC